MSESNINVVIKMRPLIRRELDKKIPVCWRKCENSLIDSSRQNEFHFDSIFDENSTTAELYDQVARPIVSKALAGVNGTIFAYGQTSSGKTYTMMGDQGNDGIMTMAIKHIFNEVQNSNTEFVLRVGFIEIYNEKIYDLYDPENVDLKVVEINNDVNVNCKEVICKSIDDMFGVIKIGNRNKKIGDTDMNDRSSRSHTIFHIAVESIDAVSEKAKISSLNLVDLAGSERASQTNSTGTRFLEGVHINMSLLSLSKVINKLINNEGGHINYRDSKLTRYLSSSLGGNALAAIICTVCPTALEETISTLYFAQRAMKVTNKPRVNEIISDATMIKKLHNQIEALKSQLNMERAKNGANSAVPRLLHELSLHQGNILNYRSVESKHKLRRRTWNTFDNDLDVIPETNPLVLSKHKMSLTEPSAALNAVAPVLQIVNAGRGTGEVLDDFPDRDLMDDEFDYKSKYEKLLFEYEELLEFTNWEKEFCIGPSDDDEEPKYAAVKVEQEDTEIVQTVVKMDPELEDKYIVQIEDLERERQRLEDLMGTVHAQMEDQFQSQLNALAKERTEMEKALRSLEQEKQSNEYLFEQNQRKAEQREADLVSMLEELKNTDLVGNAVRERNVLVGELQEQLRQLALEKEALALKIDQQDDVEQRLAKMAQVEVELVELRNTITILTNTILTLENEKKEMSVRFNESMSGSTIDCLPPAAAMVAQAASQTEAVEPESSKLQADYDEMSSKVMDLIEENEDLKGKAKELEEKLGELNSSLALKLAEMESLTSERQRFEDNSETQSEEVALLQSEKVWLEKKAQEMKKRIEELEAAKAITQSEQLELSAVLADRQSLEEKCIELTRKIQEWESQSEEITVLKSEKDLIEQRAAEMEAKVHELQRNSFTQSEEVSAFKAKKEVLEENSQKLEAQIQELESKSDIQLEEITVLKSDKFALEEKITDLETKIGDLQANFINKSEEVVNMRATKELFEENALSLEEKLRELESHSNIQLEELTALQSERESLLGHLQQSKDKIHSMEQQMQEVLRKQDEFNSLKEESEKVSLLQNELEKLIQEKEDLKGDIERVCEDRDSLIKELEASSTALREMTEEKESSCRELEKASQEVHLLIVERNCLSTEIEDKLAIISQLEKNVEESQLELQKEISERAKITGEMNNKSVELERTKTELNEEINKLKMELGDFEITKMALEEDLAQIKQDLASKCENLDKLNKELETVTTSTNTVTELQEERDKLETLLRNSTDQMKEIDQVKSTLEAEVEQLKESLEIKTQEMEKLQSEFFAASESQQAVSDSEKERERLSFELEIQLQRVHSLTNELSGLRVTLEEMESDLQEKRSLSSTVKDLQLELMDKSSKILDLETQLERLSSVEQEVLEMNEFKSSMAVKSEAQLERIHQLTKEKKDLKLELDNMRDELAEKDVELKQAKEQSNHAQRELQLAQSQQAGDHHQVDRLEKQILAKVMEIQRGNERIEESNKKMSSLKSELERKTADLATVQANHNLTMNRVESLEVKLARSEGLVAESVRELEKTKRDCANEIGRLNLEKQDGEERFKHVARQLDESKAKLTQLEVELARREAPSTSSGREDVLKLKDDIKRLRSELNGYQNKERRARRSSTFDTHRDLLSGHSVGTMTDPVSEACQCEALNEKVVELKKKCIFKDMEIVEIRESQKRSPMLLENYSLKKLLEQYKDREATLTRQIAATKKAMQSSVTQTLPDPLLEKFQDAQEYVRVTKHKYEMAKGEIKSARKQLQEMEEQLRRQAEEMEAQRHRERTLLVAQKSQDENDPAQANLPDGKKVTVQQKYDFLKVCMEKRYGMIRDLEAKLQAAIDTKACPKCRHKLPAYSPL